MRTHGLRIVVGAALLAGAGPALAQAGPATAGNAFGGRGTPNEMAAHDNAILSNADMASESIRQASAGHASGRHKSSDGVPASAADLVANAQVFDANGVALGTISRLDGDAAILATATGGQVSVPTNAFGKNKHGLMLGVTKQQFDGMVGGAK